MSLHQTQADHDADPPSAWRIVKAAERNWHLDSSLGGTIGNYPTQRDAEQGKTAGPYVTLYEREARWFAGDTPAGWRPYAETIAERERGRARAAEVAAQLARFGVYPPEVNGRNGYCLFCGGEVRAGAGLICLGHDNGGTFAAPLHNRCGELVSAEHKRARAA